MLSLTNEMRVFRPKDPSKAVHHYRYRGPSFGSALRVDNLMSKKNGGECLVKGNEYDAEYCVETDTRGNSVLTGDGGYNNWGDFTCTGLEVFLIE